MSGRGKVVLIRGLLCDIDWSALVGAFLRALHEGNSGRLRGAGEGAHEALGGPEAALTSATTASTRRTEVVGQSPARQSVPAGPIIAATKLHIPELRPRTVPRGSLVAALVGAAQTRLTLVD